MSVKAWHFLPADGRLQFGDRAVVRVGEPLHVVGPLELCRNGMHGSIRAIDALNYAPGPIICRVRHDGDIARGDDKLCSRTRTALWMYDASTVLHEFACCVAETALLMAEIDDARFWRAIEAKRAWLRGEIGDGGLGGACDAAWGAARGAAGDAARAAAWDAAWDAARAAAWAAAWDAAWDEQNDLLTTMIMEGRP